jgi:hypothetical protein
MAAHRGALSLRSCGFVSGALTLVAPTLQYLNVRVHVRQPPPIGRTFWSFDGLGMIGVVAWVIWVGLNPSGNRMLADDAGAFACEDEPGEGQLG